MLVTVRSCCRSSVMSSSATCSCSSSTRSAPSPSERWPPRRATLEIARQRFNQGLTSELDVRQFEAQVAAPAVTLAQTERARAQNEHNLNVLLGQAPVPIIRRSSLTDAVRALSVPDSIPAELLARRPDVVEAERSYAAAVARIGVADAARWPAFSIVGSYGTQAVGSSNLFGSQTNVYQALIGVSFPLFDNARLANVSAASRARAEQARAIYEGVALNALREASDALTAVRTSRDQSVAQATQANALRQALDLATLRLTKPAWRRISICSTRSEVSAPSSRRAKRSLAS